ncbi:Iron-sulfur cluster assembly 1 -like protein [Sarcoptes scabiei]|uniref:Iron-sulfur cluster assembly 1 homolog, mitochondrial n=1 Tax=Sarcoptes scabiei TaxID=52283 RepID=A0A132A6P1_SARSC|nr:Iron-sulfur cluster assembly 1 -like protein [Sarcoptes scabiei]KPM06622.1 iron-sulfur cluster assembly 1-like protein, mitochondrial-like protein [Sarcoptes scabiei]UXI17690.1 major facilitator superfamily domain-containing protein 4-A-like [Sarcoptes scabiei]
MTAAFGTSSKPSQKFMANKSAIIMTSNAVKRIKTLMKEKPDMIGLRIGVKQKGCNGFSYQLEYATEKNKFDEEVIQDGACILIDKKAQLSLLGTEMDYVETKIASQFVFKNPNIKETCGCGESFSLLQNEQIL